jgi:hypothetical protein
MWDRLGAARDWVDVRAAGRRGAGIPPAEAHGIKEDPLQRLRRSAVESLMDGRSDTTLEAALEVFEVFASGSLTDEVYILEDVGGKRIAIAPTALKDKYRRG